MSLHCSPRSRLRLRQRLQPYCPQTLRRFRHLPRHVRSKRLVLLPQEDSGPWSRAGLAAAHPARQRSPASHAAPAVATAIAAAIAAAAAVTAVDAVVNARIAVARVGPEHMEPAKPASADGIAIAHEMANARVVTVVAMVVVTESMPAGLRRDTATPVRAPRVVNSAALRRMSSMQHRVQNLLHRP